MAINSTSWATILDVAERSWNGQNSVVKFNASQGFKLYNVTESQIEQMKFKDELLDTVYNLFTNSDSYYIVCKLDSLCIDDAFGYILLWLYMNKRLLPATIDDICEFLEHHTEDDKRAVINAYLSLLEKNDSINDYKQFPIEVCSTILNLRNERI